MIFFSDSAGLSYQKKIYLELKNLFPFLLEEPNAKQFACMTVSLSSFAKRESTGFPVFFSSFLLLVC